MKLLFWDLHVGQFEGCIPLQEAVEYNRCKNYIADLHEYKLASYHGYERTVQAKIFSLTLLPKVNQQSSYTSIGVSLGELPHCFLFNCFFKLAIN